MSTITARSAVAAAACLTLLVGCGAASRQLEPAPEAVLVPALDDAAMTSVQDVQIVAQPGEWWGDPDILDAVTPIVVSITNNGDVPLRIEYRHLELMSDEGVRLSALPLYDVGYRGRTRVPVILREARPLEVGFEHRGFALAPYLAHVHRGVPVAERPFLIDPRYYAQTFPEWRAIDISRKDSLPTSEMRALALPEGVLKPGGWVGGYVYFRHPPAGIDRVRLRMSLVDAGSGRLFAIAGIPFIAG